MAQSIIIELSNSFTGEMTVLVLLFGGIPVKFVRVK